MFASIGCLVRLNTLVSSKSDGPHGRGTARWQLVASLPQPR
jgi:hypothetical protein